MPQEISAKEAREGDYIYCTKTGPSGLTRGRGYKIIHRKENSLYFIDDDGDLRTQPAGVEFHTYIRYSEETTTMNSENESKLYNTALLVRDDLVSVHCHFQGSSNSDTPYHFVCPQALASHLSPGDQVVVALARENKIVTVDSIDSELSIDPDFSREYKFIISRVPQEYAERLRTETQEIEALLRQRLRSTRRQQALNALGLTEADLQSLTFGGQEDTADDR